MGCAYARAVSCAPLSLFLQAARGRERGGSRSKSVCVFVLSSLLRFSLHYSAPRRTRTRPPWPGAASCPRTCRSCGERIRGKRERENRMRPHAVDLAARLRRPLPLTHGRLLSLFSPTASTCARPRPPARGPGEWSVGGRRNWRGKEGGGAVFRRVRPLSPLAFSYGVESARRGGTRACAHARAQGQSRCP